MLTFRGFLWVCFFLLSIPLAAWAQNTSRQDYVVDWINAEISKSDYESRFADRICETRYQANEPVTTCTYKLRDGAYAEMSENTDKLFSFILTVSVVGKEFDQTEREAMYLFSLFIWGTMPKSSSYDDANAVLRDL